MKGIKMSKSAGRMGGQLIIRNKVFNKYELPLILPDLKEIEIINCTFPVCDRQKVELL